MTVSINTVAIVGPSTCSSASANSMSYHRAMYDIVLYPGVSVRLMSGELLPDDVSSYYLDLLVKAELMKRSTPTVQKKYSTFTLSGKPQLLPTLSARANKLGCCPVITQVF